MMVQWNPNQSPNITLMNDRDLGDQATLVQSVAAEHGGVK